MRKTITAMVLVFGILLLTANVFAASVRWKLIAHPNEAQKLKDEITTMINKGYAPVGLTYTNDFLYTLYVEDRFFSVSEWVMSYYKNWDAYKKGLSDKMNKGFTPMCVSYADGTIYILYTKGKRAMAAWQSVSSAVEADDLQRSIDEYFRKDYMPVGITSIEGKFITLMAKVGGLSADKWAVEPYPSDNASIKQGINKRVGMGYIPWGFLLRGNKVNVLYIRLEKKKPLTGERAARVGKRPARKAVTKTTKPKPAPKAAARKPRTPALSGSIGGEVKVETGSSAPAEKVSPAPGKPALSGSIGGETAVEPKKPAGAAPAPGEPAVIAKKKEAPAPHMEKEIQPTQSTAPVRLSKKTYAKGISRGGRGADASGPFADKINAILSTFSRVNHFRHSFDSITGTSTMERALSLDITDDGKVTYVENSWYVPKKTDVQFPKEFRFSLADIYVDGLRVRKNKAINTYILEFECDTDNEFRNVMCVNEKDRREKKERETRFAEFVFKEKADAERLRDLFNDLLEAVHTPIDPPKAAPIPPKGPPLARVSVKKEGKYRSDEGYIDKKGQYVIKPGVKVVKGFTNGFAIVKMDKKLKYVDRTGKVLETGLEPVGEFSEGLAAAKKVKKIGYIDSTGKQIIKPQFTKARPFKEGLAAVLRKRNGTYEYIDMAGRRVIRPAYVSAGDFSGGFAKVKLKKKGKYGIIDRTGQIIAEPGFVEVHEFINGYARVKMDYDGKYGFVDKTGNMSVEPRYDFVGEFYEGVARMKIDKLYGLIDTTGKILLEPQYYHIDPFSEGRAKVQKEKKGAWGFIDKAGKPVIEPRFYRADKFSEGLASVKKDKKGLWGFIDKAGKWVIKPKFRVTGPFQEGLAAAVEKKGRLAGFINKKGKMVIKPQFDLYNEPGPFKHGLARVSKRITVTDQSGKERSKPVFGFIDKTGTIVIETRFDMGTRSFRE